MPQKSQGNKSFLDLYFSNANPNSIIHHQTSQKLSPKHAARGVAQLPYPIYRHGKACLSKQPPWRAAGDPRLARGRSRVRAPGPAGALRALFFSTLPSFLLREIVFLHFPHQTHKSVRVMCRLREKTKSRCSRRDSRVLEFFTLFHSTFFIIKSCKTSKFSNYCIRINPILHQNHSLTLHKTVILLIIQAPTQLILTIHLSNQMLYCLFMSIQEDNYPGQLSAQGFVLVASVMEDRH